MSFTFHHEHVLLWQTLSRLQYSTKSARDQRGNYHPGKKSWFSALVVVGASISFSSCQWGNVRQNVVAIVSLLLSIWQIDLVQSSHELLTVYFFVQRVTAADRTKYKTGLFDLHKNYNKVCVRHKIGSHKSFTWVQTDIIFSLVKLATSNAAYPSRLQTADVWGILQGTKRIYLCVLQDQYVLCGRKEERDKVDLHF